MTRLVDCSVSWSHAFGIMLFLGVVVSVNCFLRALRIKGSGRFVVTSVVLTIFSAPLLIGLESYCWRLNIHIPLTVFARFIVGLPFPLISVAAPLLPAVCVFISYRFDRWQKRRLSEQSVCEGLDFLPEGVCCSDSHGLPVLVNAEMHEILYAAFGLAAMDMNYLRRRLERNELNPGCTIKKYNGGVYLFLPDGSVWDLRETPVVTQKGQFTELLAFNVTDLYRGNEQLAERNERLQAVNAQIRAYNRDMDRIVREREILNAKIRLHDEFGKSLLAIRSYLSGQNADREALLSLLKRPVFLFRKDAGEDASEDSFALLQEAARAVGVTVHFEGAVPSVREEAVATAIHECITNTVKHANGHHLYVKTAENGEKQTVEITNDGDPPAGPVAETGGLANLRALCERCGVEMKIESSPRFRLILYI